MFLPEIQRSLVSTAMRPALLRSLRTSLFASISLFNYICLWTFVYVYVYEYVSVSVYGRGRGCVCVCICLISMQPSVRNVNSYPVHPLTSQVNALIDTLLVDAISICAHPFGNYAAWRENFVLNFAVSRLQAAVIQEGGKTLCSLVLESWEEFLGPCWIQIYILAIINKPS